MSPDEPLLAPDLQIITARAANEGVPVGAIARIVQRSYTAISNHLKLSVSLGAVGSMPKADWPPTQHWDARLPTVSRSANIDDVEFACRQTFRLTPLELAFLVVLLRHTFADKEKLHTVVENQRFARQFRPDKQASPDLKMVDVMICKLRAKLKGVSPQFVIETVWGKGYFISPGVKDAIYALIGAPNLAVEPAGTGEREVPPAPAA